MPEMCIGCMGWNVESPLRGCRRRTAISRAARTNSTRRCSAKAHPTPPRLQVSSTNAAYTNLDHVGTKMMSTTQSGLGPRGRKSRFTKSGAQTTGRSRTVVIALLRGKTLRIPFSASTEPPAFAPHGSRWRAARYISAAPRWFPAAVGPTIRLCVEPALGDPQHPTHSG
jgi:hypothetical protein